MENMKDYSIELAEASRVLIGLTIKQITKIKSNEEAAHRPTNCKNCGAPLHGNKCEFCDTEYHY
jgi:CRISPR/Cas system-associated exonuclease Cas4 (RecB family)